MLGRSFQSSWAKSPTSSMLTFAMGDPVDDEKLAGAASCSLFLTFSDLKILLGRLVGGQGRERECPVEVLIGTVGVLDVPQTASHHQGVLAEKEGGQVLHFVMILRIGRRSGRLPPIGECSQHGNGGGEVV